MAASSSPRVYHVAAADAGRTLVSLLRRWQPGLSWSAAKGLLESRRVAVNGGMCLDSGRRVKEGDVVHVYAHPRTPPPTAADVELLYWDDDVVVVVKPALMTTLRHREERHWPAARKNLQPTLDEVLPRLLAEAEGTRPGGPRPRRSSLVPPRRRRGRLPRLRAVHRLDRDTSGVMVFARTDSAERRLIRQFKTHSIERVYRAIVRGRPPAQTIDTRLVRDRGDGLRGSLPPDAPPDRVADAERAVTHIRPLENLGDYSLIECRLETGRTHQIRIHLSELGCPVCGDPLYHRGPGGTPLADDSGAPRLALHAARLAFTHPRLGERLEFETELPADLQRFLRRLRQRSSSAR